MDQDVDQAEVDRLNAALRLYRRVMLRVVAIGVLGLPGVVAVSFLSGLLSPPYGVYIFGQSLTDWAMVLLVVLLVAVVWLGGRAVGHALRDPVLLTVPAIGLLSAGTVIGQRAKAIGMVSGPFLGPLRPMRGR